MSGSPKVTCLLQHVLLWRSGGVALSAQFTWILFTTWHSE